MESKKNDSQMQERIELSMLYDFYGALLKENQRRMFEASVLEDYNYSEIAEDEGISRQGVYDAIRRASRQLREYEEKLGLVARFVRQKEQVKEMHHILQQMSGSMTDINNQAFEKVIAIIDEIMEE